MRESGARRGKLVEEVMESLYKQLQGFDPVETGVKIRI
jgi:hypothetical protein